MRKLHAQYGNTYLEGNETHLLTIAAFTAMLQEPFLVHGATASTGGCAVLVVINGPVREEVGMSSSFNVLGSSDRATTVIGRAIRLILCNLLDVRPGQIDRSTLGHPGKLSYCIAEDEDNSPWNSLAEDRGVPREASAVTVMAAGAPRQLMNEWTTKDKEGTRRGSTHLHTRAQPKRVVQQDRFIRSCATASQS